MKVTKIDTIQLGAESLMPGLLFVEVHTDEGITGLGETYYLPSVAEAAIHRDIAPALLGNDPADIERLWRSCYSAYARFGGHGAEMRALSAIDVALWDILGKVSGLPIYKLLGGAAHDRVPVYNTCGGPRYASVARARPGHGSPDKAGQYDDFAAFLTDAGTPAEELRAEGIGGMKIWPFDRLAHANGGRRITPKELDTGLEPVRKIRDAVGDDIEIMIDGHGLWMLEPAIKIARALAEFRPAWVEDLILADNPSALAELRRAGGVPVLASEYLVTRWDYHPVFVAGGADIAMIDPTWTGGVSESHKIATLADTFGLPVTFHDCTGPITLLAGVHLSFANSNTIYQETVRAFNRIVYPDLVTDLVTITAGHLVPPTKPGIGTELLPDLRTRPGVSVITSQL